MAEILSMEHFKVEETSLEKVFEAARGDVRHALTMLQMLSLSHKDKVLKYTMNQEYGE